MTEVCVFSLLIDKNILLKRPFEFHIFCLHVKTLMESASKLRKKRERKEISMYALCEIK